jgi:hypothetical protein
MITTARNRHFEHEYNPGGLFKGFTSAYPGRSKLHDVNTEKLKTVIEYLTHLRKIEKLTEKEFSALFTHACAIFVENEMAIVIDKVLGNAVKDLENTFKEYMYKWR